MTPRTRLAAILHDVASRVVSPAAALAEYDRAAAAHHLGGRLAAALMLAAQGAVGLAAGLAAAPTCAPPALLVALAVLAALSLPVGLAGVVSMLRDLARAGERRRLRVLFALQHGAWRSQGHLASLVPGVGAADLSELLCRGWVQGGGDDPVNDPDPVSRLYALTPEGRAALAASAERPS